MAIYNEPARPLEFLQWMADPSYCMEEVTVASGAGALKAGRVLGIITSGGKYTHYDNGASNGSEVARAVLAYDVDASAADAKATIVARLSVVKTGALAWGSNDSTGITNGLADLRAAGIIPR